MNNKIFGCLPLAWQVWQNNPIHKEAFDNFESFWGSCRRDLWFGLNDDEVLEPRFNTDGTDLKWFRERPARRRTLRPQKSFDVMLLDLQEGYRFNYYHREKMRLHKEALSRGDLPWEELFSEYFMATGEQLKVRMKSSFAKNLVIGDIVIDWFTREVKINDYFKRRRGR